MNQPELVTRIALAQIEANKDDYVTIPGTKKRFKVGFLHDYTMQKITELLLAREEIEGIAKNGSSDDVMRSAVKHPFFSIKMVALAVLNSPLKIALIYPILWRWWAYVRKFNEAQMAIVTTSIKKKIMDYCVMYYQTITCWTDTRTDVMSLTKGEVEQSLREHTPEELLHL